MYALETLLFFTSGAICLGHGQTFNDCIQSMTVTSIVTFGKQRIMISCSGRISSRFIDVPSVMSIQKKTSAGLVTMATLKNNKIKTYRKDIDASGRFPRYFNIFLEEPMCEDFTFYVCSIKVPSGTCSMRSQWLPRTTEECRPSVSDESEAVTEIPVLGRPSRRPLTTLGYLEGEQPQCDGVPEYAIVISILLAVFLTASLIFGLLIAGGTILKCPDIRRHEHVYESTTRGPQEPENNYTSLNPTPSVDINQSGTGELPGNSTQSAYMDARTDGRTSDVNRGFENVTYKLETTPANNGPQGCARYSTATSHYEQMS